MKLSKQEILLWIKIKTLSKLLKAVIKAAHLSAKNWFMPMPLGLVQNSSCWLSAPLTLSFRAACNPNSPKLLLPTAPRCAKPFPLWSVAAYHLVHQRFGVGSIEEIAAEDLPEAVEYVHMLTMCGEVLEKQPAPQGVVLTERQMGHFAAGAYMLDLATRRLADLSEPLKMLGARDKGVSAWTIRDEAEIWIKNCRSALEAVLPQMGDNFYRGSVQESLRMMDALAAR